MRFSKVKDTIFQTMYTKCQISMRHPSTASKLPWGQSRITSYPWWSMNRFGILMVPLGPRNTWDSIVQSPVGPGEIGTNPCDTPSTATKPQSSATQWAIAHISEPILINELFLCCCGTAMVIGPQKTIVRSPMGPREIDTNPCDIPLPLKPALTTLSPISHLSGPIRHNTVFKNEIWRIFLRKWTVREYLGNFFGNGQYEKVREIFRTGMDGTGSTRV